MKGQEGNYNQNRWRDHKNSPPNGTIEIDSWNDLMLEKRKFPMSLELTKRFRKGKNFMTLRNEFVEFIRSCASFYCAKNMY